MKFILILSLPLLLSACASAPLTSSNPGLHTVPVGSVVKLNQPLTIRAGRVDTAVQYGEATLAVDPYEPHCKFEVNTIAKKTFMLPAGDYRITRVVRYSDPFFSHNEGKTIRVASSSAAAAWLGMASPDSHWYYTTVFRLQSELHPDIRQLVCGTVFPSGFESRDITISEFETLAGNVMSLQIAVK